jgi:serine/threonine protein phosphatase PrpC
MAQAKSQLWESAAFSDVGRVRDHNEDVYLARPDLGLFMVCDGMGGHSAGEVAAALATETASEFFESLLRDPEGTWPFKIDEALGEEGSRLAVALRLANERIRQVAQGNPRQANMGTTAVAVFLSGARSYVAHAGDSRAYLFRDGKLWPVTHDHSLLGEYIRAKSPSAAEIEAFPYKNVISRALGPMEEVQVDVAELDMRPGDVLLLCCDGLHGLIADKTIAAILAAHPDLDGAGQALVDAANQAGGTDNITVVLVRRKTPASAA